MIGCQNNCLMVVYPCLFFSQVIWKLQCFKFNMRTSWLWRCYPSLCIHTVWTHKDQSSSINWRKLWYDSVYSPDYSPDFSVLFISGVLSRTLFFSNNEQFSRDFLEILRQKLTRNLEDVLFYESRFALIKSLTISWKMTRDVNIF